MRTADEFWSKVTKGPGCWLWTGTTNAWGYGTLRWHDRRENAHRVAFELATGEAPGRRSILHSCDTRPCVRPTHLRAGTQSENIREMWARGRAICRLPRRAGEAHYAARLTDRDVAEIRASAASGTSRQALATRFRVAKNYVDMLVAGSRRPAKVVTVVVNPSREAVDRS